MWRLVHYSISNFPQRKIDARTPDLDIRVSGIASRSFSELSVIGDAAAVFRREDGGEDGRFYGFGSVGVDEGSVVVLVLFDFIFLRSKMKMNEWHVVSARSSQNNLDQWGPLTSQILPTSENPSELRARCFLKISI